MSTIINGRSSLYCHFNKIIKESGISFQSAALSQKHVRNVGHTATVVLRPFGRLLYPFRHSNSGTQKTLFKACVCYFFIFSPNDSRSKTMKNVFYFIWKALFDLRIFKFLHFCPPLFFSLSAIALKDYGR